MGTGQALQAVRIQSRESAFFLDVAVGRRRGIKISRRPKLDRGLDTAGDAHLSSTTSRRSSDSDSESQTSTTRAMERVAGTAEPARERESGSEVQTDGRAWRRGVSGTWLTPGVGPARCHDYGERTPL